MQHQWRSWAWRLRSPKDLRSWMELCKNRKKRGSFIPAVAPANTVSYFPQSSHPKATLLLAFCPFLLSLLLCFPMNFESYQYSPSMFLLCLVRVGICYLPQNFPQQKIEAENKMSSWHDVQVLWNTLMGVHLHRAEVGGGGWGMGKGLRPGTLDSSLSSVTRLAVWTWTNPNNDL